jgi:hypothetical protein
MNRLRVAAIVLILTAFLRAPEAEAVEVTCYAPTFVLCRDQDAEAGLYDTNCQTYCGYGTYGVTCLKHDAPPFYAYAYVECAYIE